MWKKKIAFLLLFSTLLIPFLFYKSDRSNLLNNTQVNKKVVIITPHNEAVRYEFGLGFKKWYKERTGEDVKVDWRVMGGTQEIIRYVHTLYISAFKYFWENTLKKVWSQTIAKAFISFNETSQLEAKSINKKNPHAIFLSSDVSCGMDILFGGGEIDTIKLAQKGFLVPSNLSEKHPEWFLENSMPEMLGGVYLRDPHMRWLATTYSGFGIIYNEDVLERINIQKTPKAWSELTSPLYFGLIALADPTVSSTANRAFEMIIYEQMYLVQNNLAESNLSEVEKNKIILEKGWEEGLKSVQLIAANARYFTDFSTKPVLDVSAGDCAVGMAIDYYGLFQKSNLKFRSKSTRFGFTFPKGPGLYSPDVISLFRGAPNREVAEAFIEYVLSMEGQKLWCFSPGSPGGPKRYALNRLPIRKELYEKTYEQYRLNPQLNAYHSVGSYIYHQEWIFPVFNVMRFVIKAAFINAHTELSNAWKAITEANNNGETLRAKKALACLQNMDKVNYKLALNHLKPIIEKSDPLALIRLEGSLTKHFIDQYQMAEALAKKGNF